jgi:hypothetical protein
MLGFIADFLVAIIEKLSLGLWKRHKLEDAIETQNKIAGESDATVAGRLRKWTKPD